MTEIGDPSNQQVSEAIAWLVRFESGVLSADERRDFERWYAQSPQNALAWQRLGRASQLFQADSSLNSKLALQSLQVADKQMQNRRRALVR